MNSISSKEETPIPSSTARAICSCSKIGPLETSGVVRGFNPVGRRLRGLKPSVDEAYTNSTSDIIGRWRRKSRAGMWQTSLPFNRWIEDMESITYEVDFINQDNSVVRTITTTASSNGSVITLPADPFTGNVTLHYDTVDISADSFDGTTFICYQINSQLNYNAGRGEANTIIIDERS